MSIRIANGYSSVGLKHFLTGEKTDESNAHLFIAKELSNNHELLGEFITYISSQEDKIDRELSSANKIDENRSSRLLNQIQELHQILYDLMYVFDTSSNYKEKLRKLFIKDKQLMAKAESMPVYHNYTPLLLVFMGVLLSYSYHLS